ncbi:hypothetical protein CDEST_12612 [Colletotrichum destructivum]|uniref:Uncharacterized protein n=1 Tax=Colletotrichum destructivum TaxID=34406 RepID=A0AAX4IWF3_9PEZI|nr:hypothetical protein CDEST_12612 [Colletotrichum destructivum]
MMGNDGDHLHAEASLRWRLVLDASDAGIEEGHDVDRRHIGSGECGVDGLGSDAPCLDSRLRQPRLTLLMAVNDW